ncbi:hypothetical protein SAMN02799630_02313 [Paenibacillus sp. UNCCL117]|uniref:DUF6022 family protein n=1 Tax=unclassified Paenibacillus TaxID=185978 RepID=UPI00088ED5A6|nr:MULTISPECIES: DUF6022 family protein [unclassified Paenibacillus]SDD17234.1 hypothetical protein SAMN04488602_106189 [Paenibacillus sp. cl123]SFW34919.1 hypothetical protein SAMN02799630_02313 [Paenibacillus sp. UNCCL117]
MEKEFPIFRQDMAIEEIREVANRYIDSEWKSLYESMYEQLTAAFVEIEDAAYGLYLDQLMPFIFEQLEDAGFSAMEKLEENDFVIAKRLVFRNSLEKWGTEDNRSRIFWNVIHDKQGSPIGTLLTEIPHSHLKFDIPSAPVVYALRETIKEQVVQGIRRIKESS